MLSYKVGEDAGDTLHDRAATGAWAVGLGRSRPPRAVRAASPAVSVVALTLMTTEGAKPMTRRVAPASTIVSIAVSDAEYTGCARAASAGLGVRFSVQTLQVPALSGRPLNTTAANPARGRSPRLANRRGFTHL